MSWHLEDWMVRLMQVFAMCCVCFFFAWWTEAYIYMVMPYLIFPFILFRD